MQADDADVQAARQFQELVDLADRQAELGILATGAHLGVMAIATPQVHAQPKLAAAEHFRPALQGFDVVQGQGDAQGQRAFVFAARGKTRGEQHALRGKAGHRLEHALQFTQRHAFQAKAFLGQQAQDRRVRIGLDGEIAMVDGRNGGQAPRTLTHRGQVIDITRRTLPGQIQQALVLTAPPGRFSLAHAAVDFAPARTKHTGLFHRHRATVDQRRMQDLQQTIGIGFVNDERQVEVVGGLRNHVHAFLPERGPHVRQLVQQRTHAAADKGDGSARHDHLDLADFRQVGAQRGQHIGVDQVVAGIQRNGHVGFGRTNQVHRQTVLAEAGEHVGQEADLLPHANAFHRNQHDAIATADGLHPGHGQCTAINAGAGQFGTFCIKYGHGHSGIAARFDGTGMQHFGASGGDLLCFVIIQSGQQACIRHFAWVGAEHARHVRPDFHPLRPQQRTEIRR